MAFQTGRADYADLDALAGVLVRAHVSDPLFQGLFRRVHHDARVTWYADSFRKTWQEDWIRYYKTVEMKTGNIVAMSCFHYPRIRSKEEKPAGEIDYYGSLPQGANAALGKEFYDKIEHYERRYVDREKTYFVYLLSTLPEYHRQGLGRQLMEICLRDADAANTQTFLIATEAGSGLYGKLGFREIDRLTFDTPSLDGEETVTWLCMMREPSAIVGAVQPCY